MENCLFGEKCHATPLNPLDFLCKISPPPNTQAFSKIKLNKYFSMYLFRWNMLCIMYDWYGACVRACLESLDDTHQ